MITTTIPLNLQVPLWQSEQHLKSGDRVWILTDVETYESPYMAVSKPQALFKVGIYDLQTQHVGWGIFGRDIAYAMIKAGAEPAPWGEPRSHGIKIMRPPHDNDEEKGRYLVSVLLFHIEPELLDLVPVAKKKFASAGHCPNSTPSMWQDLVIRAAKENAIEKAALAMVGPFAAGDVRAAIGDPNADVTPVLQKLVRERKLLPPVGQKRWTRYEVAPPKIIDRADWTD